MNALKIFAVCTIFSLTACVDELPIDVPAETEIPITEAPQPDESSVPALSYDGIISKNIQNLLCNSVHHAEGGRLEQAYHKLDIVKNDKLIALLNKSRISQEEYIALDTWLAELIEYLYIDIDQYPSIEQTFPFSCLDKDEQTEAIGEVIELSEEYESDKANKFLRKVCYSISASEKNNVLAYAQATAFLGEASIIAGTMLLDNELEQTHKNELTHWIEQLITQLLNNPAQYSELSDDFNCELYEDETPNDIINNVVDTIGGIFVF